MKAPGKIELISSAMKLLRFVSRLAMIPNVFLGRVRAGALGLAGLSLLLANVGLQAQEPLANSVFTIGTTATNSQGASWGYFLWQPTEPNALRGHKIAVYAKTGDANSAANYQRRSITQRQTDPAVIQALLNRAVNLGDDLGILENRINALFAAAVPIASLTLPEKVSAVIRGADKDPQLLANIVFLGRLHPSLNMCLGHAWAEPVPAGKTTFEIRDFDSATETDLGVIGRVTVDSGAPIILPPPGPPVQFNEPSAKGDLNIKLRWTTPDALREVGLLQHGFNLYRMTKQYAEANNFHINPPLREQIPALVGSGFLKKINESPVTVRKLYDAASVVDFGNDPTWYVADDNKRYQAGGTAFNNGDQFYYFVAARDLLGRDGFVSQGTLAMACDRLPPDAPEGVKVENHYTFNAGISNQVLKITWRQAPNTSDVVTAYYVYRWTNATDSTKYALLPATNRIAGPIPHVANQTYASIIDNGPGSPKAPADYNKTYWYTVRAVDMGACTNNFSPNSSPAFGVLRDRTAPDAPTGDITILCCRPLGRSDKDFFTRDTSNFDTNRAYYRFIVVRTNAGLGAVEFYYTRGNLETNAIARVPFPSGKDPLVFEWSISRLEAGNGVNRTFARIIASDDEETAMIEGSNNQVPDIGDVHVVNFVAYIRCQEVRVRNSPNTGGRFDCVHTPVNPDDGETIEPPGVVVMPAVGSKEFRLYRRVNFGPMTLIKNGPITNDPPTEMQLKDPNPPANAAVLCYYVQTLDEHGNASPLTQIGDCLNFKLPNPKPLLSPIEAKGDEDAPKMAIRWFCPPFGVERFEVFIAIGGGTMPEDIGGSLTRVSGVPATKWVKLPGSALPVQREFFIYRTPRVGPQFGDGGFFETIVKIELNKNYLVFIKPVGLDGTPDPDSQNSKLEKFAWSAPVLQGPLVPWPARPLASVATNVFPDWVRPVFLNNTNITTNFIGVGIIVGSYSGPAHKRLAPGQPAVLDSTVDPTNHIVKSVSGESLFPLVVYRFQETNQVFPSKVSGDLVQVTPMMETIAYTVGVDQQLGSSALIYDPFIDVFSSSWLPLPDQGSAVGRNGIVLLDTQPVVLGARYRYLLVRFGENREILEVIPTEPVDIL